MRPSVLPVLVALTSALAAAQPRVWLQGSVDGAPPSTEWVYARVEQQVIVHAQATAPVVPGSWRWFWIEPAVAAVDNTLPSFHWAQLHYQERELETCRGEPRCELVGLRRRFGHVSRAEGAGTFALRAEARSPSGERLSSPGMASVEQGGLSRQVYRVARRTSDDLLGFLTELIGTPYIFGSSGPQGRHQADLLIGSDCADLAVYAARRAGLKVPYVSTFTLDRHAQEIARAGALGSSPPIRVGEGPGQVRPGDLLLFPGARHVAVLWSDEEPKGVLDPGDLMLHTCWAPPTIEPVGRSGCAHGPVRVLRFPEARSSASKAARRSP
jgi:cell wall-associated NlpC family hydrolase